MNQSKLESRIEVTLNIGSGFILSFFTWAWLVKPLIDMKILSLDDTFEITMIFTAISVIRSYYWRRAFDKKIPHRIVEWAKTHRITQWLLSYVK